MKIGIDLDNTIDASEQSIRFFRLLTQLFFASAEIHILTNREPGSEATVAHELEELGIRYHHLVITEKKAQYIGENRIEIFFDDTDEYFLELGPEVCVFKIREAGNFSFAEKKFLGSSRTVKMIDEEN